ncbi:hypothetical protein [Curvivirga sp.]|uniref:hypothetical protein n=1 Tax=Curvivirga sp. TaxID=2856848 RepID=UPI003B5A2A50
MSMSENKNILSFKTVTVHKAGALPETSSIPVTSTQLAKLYGQYLTSKEAEQALAHTALLQGFVDYLKVYHLQVHEYLSENGIIGQLLKR